jgi:hypothetical protein
VERAHVIIALAALCCAHREELHAETRPVEDDVAAAPDERSRDDGASVADRGDASGADIDFSDEVATPSSGVVAQPERRPSGAFELCGDKCRDNVDLKKSFDDSDDDSEEGRDRSHRRRKPPSRRRR